MLRTGVCAGHNGPTAFVMKGIRKAPGYTNKFLEKEGCEPGSCIVMTENAFMTDEAWYDISKSVVPGYRQLPVIKDNPQWSALEVFDGFGSHMNSPEANELRVRDGPGGGSC
mmetsp:Transcript_38277/g.92337  ORF Transcript_38277/g.92337 Transcript_38277/m.92337 type:complete len:112 (-) Transcript_38277:1235-1570(-)